MSQQFVFGPNDSARVRFAISPLWEALAALRVLAEPARRAFHLPWLDQVRPRLSEIRVDLLLGLSPRGVWTPDFLTPMPAGPETTATEQLAQLRATPPDLAAAQIERHLNERGASTAPAAVLQLLEDPASAPAILAAAFERCWELLVAPYWPRLHDRLSSDIRHRVNVLGDYGLDRLLNDLHRRVRWTGRRIVIDSDATQRRFLDGAGLVLLPSAFIWPDVVPVLDPPTQPCLIYAARGIAELWKPAATPRSQALNQLVGRTRSAVLHSLKEPASTTTLATRQGLSPGTISEHLLVLFQAGLISRYRHRHTVIYQLTPLGDQLIEG